MPSRLSAPERRRASRELPKRRGRRHLPRRANLGMMITDASSAPIRHLLPTDNENKWSDLLAVLIEVDPASAVAFVGGTADALQVERELVAGGERLDLLVTSDSSKRAAIEVKVLHGLGSAQLRRYAVAYPDVDRRLVVFPARLVLDLSSDPDWTGVTWEDVLGPFTTSRKPWIAEIARAWLQYLNDVVPSLGPETAWNDLREGEDFFIALRARIGWVYRQLRPKPPVSLMMAQSGAGVGWVVGIKAETPVPGYFVHLEVEDRLPVREWPRIVKAGRPTPRGPSIKLCLRQEGVRTSATFNWEHLAALWPLIGEARHDWVASSARPRAPHDVAGWQLLQAKGVPSYVGIGFGEKQAQQSRMCMFGVRLQLPPTILLGELAEMLNGMMPLVEEMASVAPPTVFLGP
jgi:hypothetical protein